MEHKVKKDEEKVFLVFVEMVPASLDHSLHQCRMRGDVNYH